MTNNWPLLGVGRTADIFDIGDGRVLRRYRRPFGEQPGRQIPTEDEAAVMTYARERGFPVPVVYDATRSDIVMDRVRGPSLLEDVGRRPWKVFDHAAALSDLHERLHRIAAPPAITAGPAAGDSLLHMDLHPDNVILTSVGPVVIDWANAARGPDGADVAWTWIVLASADPGGNGYRRALTAMGRSLFLRAFLRRAGRAQAARYLHAVEASPWCRHRNFEARERRRIERLVRAAQVDQGE